MILPKAELTPSGRPKLVPGEVERVLLDKVQDNVVCSGSVPATVNSSSVLLPDTAD
jgi:hypothetical protein